ncbi:MAG: potassium channel family protein [Candidatus Hermodarchaeia archaeon]|jgi:uncharacterized protein with PhoU and TrkA domain
MQEGFQKVRYQPVTVRNLLVEMKNLSELMIDLAYSAVLFQDRGIAEEVMEMEKRVDYLSYHLLMSASLAIRDKEDAEQLAGVMKAASSANKISDTAAGSLWFLTSAVTDDQRVDIFEGAMILLMQAFVFIIILTPF